MKRILALSSVFLLLVMPTAQAANPKAGGACPKLKSTKVYNGKLFTCIAKGKSKVWDKGSAVKQTNTARPQNTQPPKSPSNSNSNNNSNTNSNGNNNGNGNSNSPQGTVLVDAGKYGIVRTVSTNGGNTQPLECRGSDGNQGFRSQKTFFVDPKNPSRLGIAVEYKGFYISNDGGTTWNISSTGLIAYGTASDAKRPCHTEFSVLTLDPQDSNRLLVARASEPGTIKDYFSENAGIYESKDGGKSWKQILTQEGIGVYVHDGLAISHQNGQIIYAGTTTNARTLGGENKVYPKTGIVYKTVNGGKTWTELPTGVPADVGVQHIVIDPKDDNVVTVSTFGRVKSPTGSSFGPGLGIIKTTDGGATWKRIDVLTSGFSSVEFSENNPLNAIGVTYDSQVLATSDGGVTWTKLNGAFALRAIGYDPFDKSGETGLFAGNSGEIFSFSANGTKFTAIGNLPSLSDLSIRVTRLAFSANGALYAAGHYTNNSSRQVGFVFKSTDSGKTWVKVLDSDRLE